MRHRLTTPDDAPRLLAVPGGLLFLWAVGWLAGFRSTWLEIVVVVGVLLYVPLLAWVVLRSATHVGLEGPRPIATSPDSELAWKLGPDGALRYLSSNLEAFFGYGADEILGHPMSVLLAPFEHPRLAKLIADRSYPTYGWTDLLWTYVTKDGQERQFLSSAVAQADSSGRAVGFEGTLRDPDRAEQHTAQSDLRAQIRHVIDFDQLTSVFQPILDTRTGGVLGAECLSRFSTAGPAKTPDAWFAEANRVGMGADLELFAVRTALRAAHSLPADIYLSINLSPATLLTGQLPALLATAGWQASRLVLEITEHVSVSDYQALADSLIGLRADGMRLAVDDAGAGYESFRHILALSPDYIKLDRDLVADLDADVSRRALVHAMMIFAVEIGATVIAEGVETTAELETARSLGVQAAQGFLTGRPMPAEDWAHSDA